MMTQSQTASPAPPPAPPLEWTPLRVVQGTLVVIAVALGFWLAIANRNALFSLFVAIVISTAISPAVDWLRQRGLPRALGVIAIYLGLLAVVVGVLWLLAPLVAEQGARMSGTLAGVYQDVAAGLQNSPSRLVRRLSLRLPAELSLAPAAEEGGVEVIAAVARALSYLGLFGDGLFVFVAVLLLAFYWTLDRERLLRSLLLLLPAERRDDARQLFLASEAKVGGYIRGLALLCVLVGVLALAAYLLLGLPNALLLALAAGLFEAVPVVGPALGALPAVAVALTLGPDKVIGVLAVTAVIQLVENTILVPRVMGRTVGVNPVVTLLSLAAFSRIFGLPGALLAIPLAAVFQVLLDRFVLGPAAADTEAPAGRGRASVLRYEARELVADARKLLREKPADLPDASDGVEDSIEALAADLDSLLARALPGEEAPAPAGQAAPAAARPKGLP
jgi:predicted PurR-regulated permease PerM